MTERSRHSYEGSSRIHRGIRKAALPKPNPLEGRLFSFARELTLAPLGGSHRLFGAFGPKTIVLAPHRKDYFDRQWVLDSQESSA